MTEPIEKLRSIIEVETAIKNAEYVLKVLKQLLVTMKEEEA